MIAPDVGGGFGGKLQHARRVHHVHPARRLGKPVKYTETRSESLMAAHHGRDQWQKLTGGEKDGTVTGFKVELIADLGRTSPRRRWRTRPRGVHVQRDLAVPGLPVPRADGPHQQDLDRRLSRRRTTRSDLRHRTDDGRARREVGVDPLEVREKNWIKHEEFPFTTVSGLEYDSGNYEVATSKAKEKFGYDELRAEQKQRRESKTPSSSDRSLDVHRDVRPPPRRVLGRLDYGAGGWEHATVRMLPTGKVEVVTGACAHGRDTRPRSPDRRRPSRRGLRRHRGAPRGHPVAHKGMDTYGSRSLVVGGEALVRAADKVIEKAKPIAAHMLEANVDDIEYKAGRLGVRGTDQGVGIAEVALAAFAAHDLPDGVEPALDRTPPSTR